MTDTVKTSDLSRTRLLVGSAGGEVTAVDEHGEVQWAVGLTPGIHEARQFADYMQPGWDLHTDRGVTPMVDQTRRARANMPAPNALDSGANPDFRPTMATREEARLRQIEKRIQASERRVEQRLAQAEILAQRAQAATPDDPPKHPEGESTDPPKQPEVDTAEPSEKQEATTDE